MSRRKQLGDLGERWTKQLLEDAGFKSVQDLNEIRYNHPGGDFLATRRGQLYFITVKARNKYQQGTRRLNGGYNIYPERVRLAAKPYGAIPAWLTIQLDTDRRCYSAYFGTIDSLRNPQAVAVPMTVHAVSRYECLASDTLDPAITPELSNQFVDLTRRHPPSFAVRVTSAKPLSKERARRSAKRRSFVRGSRCVCRSSDPASTSTT